MSTEFEPVVFVSVIDQYGQNLAGAHVEFLSGSTLLGSVRTGNRPANIQLKRAIDLTIRVTYKDKTETVTIPAGTDRYTFTFEGPPMPPPAPPPEARPTLIDVLIVGFASVAIVLFVFWIANQAIGGAVFERIPAYIGGAFETIWSALAAGVAGIGLAAYRAFVEKDRPTPDYFSLILRTVGGLIGVAVLLMVLFVALEWFRATIPIKPRSETSSSASTPVPSTPTAPSDKKISDAKSGPPAGDEWQDAKWSEAQENIRWVLEKDPGAKRTYDKARAGGQSKYQAVLTAQGHNLSAQTSIQKYGEARTERFIQSIGH